MVSAQGWRGVRRRYASVVFMLMRLSELQVSAMDTRSRRREPDMSRYRQYGGRSPPPEATEAGSTTSNRRAPGRSAIQLISHDTTHQITWPALNFSQIGETVVAASDAIPPR